MNATWIFRHAKKLYSVSINASLQVNTFSSFSLIAQNYSNVSVQQSYIDVNVSGAPTVALLSNIITTLSINSSVFYCNSTSNVFAGVSLVQVKQATICELEYSLNMTSSYNTVSVLFITYFASQLNINESNIVVQMNSDFACIIATNSPQAV